MAVSGFRTCRFGLHRPLIITCSQNAPWGSIRQCMRSIAAPARRSLTAVRLWAFLLAQLAQVAALSTLQARAGICPDNPGPAAQLKRRRIDLRREARCRAGETIAPITDAVSHHYRATS